MTDMSFLDNPRLFLETHTVAVSEQIPNPETGGVRTFSITPLMPSSPTYVINQDDRDGEGFRAFWVPYRANHYSEYDLSSAGDFDAEVQFILTFTLSGCTFAAGSGRRPKLAHINHQVEGEIDQERIDQDLRAHFDDTAALTLKKAGYFGKAQGFANTKYTVMGVLEIGDWVFYLNTKGQFANGMQAWQLHGMVDIPTPGAHGGARRTCTIL